MFKKTLLAGALGAAMLTAALPQTALAENTLRMAYDADPVSLDIHEQLSGGILQLSHMAFDPLVRWTKDFEFEPRLATEWEQVDDTTMRISLREGVTFHSGNPFTAEDVAWTVERLKRSPDFKAIFEPIETVNVVDEHTVEIVSKRPNPLLLNMATYIFPMDSQFYSGETDGGKAKDEIVKNGNSYASRNISGTGPFQVPNRQQGIRLAFERFDDGGLHLARAELRRDGVERDAVTGPLHQSGLAGAAHHRLHDVDLESAGHDVGGGPLSDGAVGAHERDPRAGDLGDATAEHP